MSRPADRYTHGHHESVLRSHVWRTAENSAGFLLTHLRSGDALLDVGCGPGTISSDLARLVAPGIVVGIDRSIEVIDVARRGLDETGPANLTFQLGDVYDLDFDDATFDVVYAHQVLQHLSDPVRALREMRRVLRSNGLLAIRDADYSAFTWSPPDPRLDQWMELYHQITKRNDAEADAGQFLERWAQGAGFDAPRTSTSTWTFRSVEERVWWGDLWADRVLQSEFARQSLGFGLATLSELQTISLAFREWAEKDDGVFLVVHTEILARK